MNGFERMIMAFSPSWGAKRAEARSKAARAQLATETVRGFDAVSKGRRVGSDWQKLGAN